MDALIPSGSLEVPDKLPTIWIWWAVMLAVSLFNVGLYVRVRKSVVPASDPSIRQYQKRMALLAIPMVFECAWRSWFPNVYDTRQVLIDQPMSSILLNRSFATVAEICWTAQMGLALVAISNGLRGPHFAKNRPAGIWTASEMAAVCMVVCSVCGETQSVTSMATTNHFYEVTEGLCWCALFTIGASYSMAILPDVRKQKGNTVAKVFIAIMLLAGLIFLPYMMFFYLPTYWQLYQLDQAAGKEYLPIIFGLKDSALRRVQTSDWADWKDQWFWMTGTFVFSPWTAIILVLAPRIQSQPTLLPNVEVEVSEIVLQ